MRRLDDLPRAIHRAVKTALAPPIGPVFLSLPGDILTDSADLDLGAPSRVATGIRGDASAIVRAAAIIAKARSPVIIAGDAVPQGNALQELVAFAEALGAPVYDEGMASRAMFPSSHPLYRGALVRLPAAIRGMLAQHDLLVSIGADLFTLSLPDEVEVDAGRLSGRASRHRPLGTGEELSRNRSRSWANRRSTLPELTGRRAAGPVRAPKPNAASKRLEHVTAEGIASLAQAARDGRGAWRNGIRSIRWR